MKKFKFDGMTFKQNLIEKGLSQEEAAKIFEVSRNTINSICNNRFDPSLDLALKIAEYFNTNIEMYITRRY